LNRLFDTYNKVMFCTLGNVRSQQLHDVRRGLRGKGEFLMGKKTMQKKIITARAANSSSSLDQALKKTMCDDEFLSGNLGMLFTNESVESISAIVTKYRVQAPARVGAISPCDVVIPAGNTGLEPTQTGFFQALNIATKIAKGMVEIVSDKKVLSTGDKVDNSTAALLQKLKISPFFYAVEVVSVWDRGVLFTAEDLKINDASIEEQFMTGISNLTALSLGSGVPTELSFPHTIIDGFKNLLAASVETSYTFPEFDGAATIKAIKEGKATGAPAAADAPKGGKPAAAAPAAAAPPPPKPDDDDDDALGGGLFF